MSFLDGIFTLQPEELFKKSPLEQINDLSDAEAIALLPKINTLLAQEAAAWADHCASVQSKRYTIIITQAHAQGVAVEVIKAMAIHHVLVSLPARFAVLARMNRSEPLEPLSEVLTVVSNGVQQSEASGNAEYGRASRRNVVYDREFAEAISEQEATLTDLENLRMDQLRRMRMMLSGARQLDFTSTEHVVAFVSMMEEFGIDLELILPQAKGENSEASVGAEADIDGE